MKETKSGFTIVELLIVIVVIAILATISIVAYRGIQQRANNSAATAAARQALGKIQAHFTTEGSYPATLSEVGISGSNVQYAVNNAASPATFCITATSGSSSYYVSNTQMTPASGGCAGHGVGGVAAITNVAPNPGAEENLGWPSNNGTTYPRSISTSVRRSGTQSIEAHNTGSSTLMMSLYAIGALNSGGFPVEPNKTYHISIYFRSGVPHQGRIGCSFGLSDGTYGTTTYGGYTQGTVNQWSRATHSCTSPANATVLRLLNHVYSLSTQPADTSAYADDLMVVEGSTQYEYADGSSPNWIWNGTAHNATSTGPPL